MRENNVNENMKKYEEAMKEHFGEDMLEKINEKTMNLSKQELEEMNRVKIRMIEMLENAIKNNIPYDSIKAKEIIDIHKVWISYTWDYTKDNHIKLVNMYVHDERINNTYDKMQKECMYYLKKAVEEENL